jgi:hypothetical protein
MMEFNKVLPDKEEGNFLFLRYTGVCKYMKYSKRSYTGN